MKVLEVGCGTGTNLALFADKGCAVSGIDLSAHMLDQAKKKLGEAADLRLGDASAMPFDSGSFDLVVAFLTLHEMPASMRGIGRRRNGEGRQPRRPPPLRRFPPWALSLSQRAGSTVPIIVPIEIAAGREHFRNHRDFLSKNGLPGLIAENGLTVQKERILGGGNILVSTAQKSR